MKTNYLYAVAMAAVFLTASCEDKKKPEDSVKAAEEVNEEKFDSTKIEDDAEFVVKAAEGGMFEVQLGQLAVSNGTSKSVKELGQHIVDDHSKANDELKALAARKNITLPSSLSETHQKKYDDLAKKTGADFDKEYADLMVSDHKEDIDAFQKEADKGHDEELKAWAAGKIPTLNHHLEMAKSTQEAVKK